MNVPKPFFVSLAIHICIIAATAGIWNALSTHSQPETRIRIALLNAAAEPLSVPHPLRASQPAIAPITTPRYPESPKRADHIPPKPLSVPAPAAIAVTPPAAAPVAAVTPAPLKLPENEPVAPKAPPPPNVQAEYEEENLGRIRTLLAERLKYPKNALRLRQQGNVIVTFTLSPSGDVSALSMTKSSEFELLDDAARTLILTTASVFPKPSRSVRITIPIEYKIR